MAPVNASHRHNSQHPIKLIQSRLSTLTQPVIYEFPLNERIRIFLRLEHLFHQLIYFLQGNTVWDSRAVIGCLLDILAIFSRNDLKSEILKEMDRHSKMLAGIARNSNVDTSKLTKIMEELKHISSELQASNGKIGMDLAKNELFKSISQRSSIPGGTCSFDLPAYYYWLQQEENQRKQDLLDWIKPFELIHKAIDLVLRFIRQSSMPSSEIAESGFYQQPLERELPFQLLRISIESSVSYFAEISGGKHRFTVRFMTTNPNERPSQTDNNVPFLLTCCVL